VLEDHVSVLGEGDRADVTGAAPFLGHALEELQNARVLHFIRRSCPEEARGLDPGPSLEGIDLESGVFRDGREARPLLVVERLQPRVLEERSADLLRSGKPGKTLERQELEPDPPERLSLLRELAATSGREEKLRPLSRDRAPLAGGR
jgi:hypothetical protein